MKGKKMFYTGIGARSTPQNVLQVFTHIAKELGKAGFALRSGAADGADHAFEIGCDQIAGIKEIYEGNLIDIKKQGGDKNE